MTTIYLIRHAEAEGNLYRIAQGQDNSNLTDRGWRQVRALEERFRDVKIDAVYSSDLFRTKTTASAIYQPKGLELRPRSDLREIHIGVWEDVRWVDLARKHGEMLQNFGRRMDIWAVPGAETAEEVQSRMPNAVYDMAEKHPGETILICTHGGALQRIFRMVTGVMDESNILPASTNASISMIEFQHEVKKWRLLNWNITDHLNGLHLNELFVH